MLQVFTLQVRKAFSFYLFIYLFFGHFIRGVLFG